MAFFDEVLEDGPFGGKELSVAFLRKHGYGVKNVFDSNNSEDFRYFDSIINKDSWPVTFHLNAAPHLSEDTLRRVYLKEPQVATLRHELEQRTDEGVVRYRAFLEARDNVQLLEQFAPGALGLTVSPRPGRLGVLPLPPPADVLPYHGMPLFKEKQGEITIEYRWDLLTEAQSYTSLHLEGDEDGEPYLLISSS